MKRGLVGAAAALALMLTTGGVALATEPQEEMTVDAGVAVEQVVADSAEEVVEEEVAAEDPAEEITEQVAEEGEGVEEEVAQEEVAEEAAPEVPPVADERGVPEWASRDSAAAVPKITDLRWYGECKIYAAAQLYGAGQFDATITIGSELEYEMDWDAAGPVSGFEWTATIQDGIEQTSGPVPVVFVILDRATQEELAREEIQVDAADINRCGPASLELLDVPEGGAPAGSDVKFEGGNFQAGETVALTLFNDEGYQEKLGDFVVDANGYFSGTFRVPADAPPGEYGVFAFGQTSGKDAVAFMKVAQEAVPLSATILDPTRDGCKVSIPVEVNGPGSLVLRVWDDGEVIDEMAWESTEAGVHVVTWTITKPAGTEANGVTFAVYDAATDEELDDYEDFEYPAEVADQCSATVPVTLELPGTTSKGVVAGAKVQVAGEGYLPGEEVALTLSPAVARVLTPTSLGVATADKDGKIAATVTVPAGTEPGEYTVSSLGSASGRSASVGLLVYAEPESPAKPTEPAKPAAPAKPEAELAKTGADSSGLLALSGLALLGLGVAAAAASRRRI